MSAQPSDPAPATVDRSGTTTSPATPGRRRTLVVRWVGALLLLGNAGIHLDLWLGGYRDFGLIGPAFLLDVVLATVAAVLVLFVPERRLPEVAALGALLQLGTLGALLLALTVSLFGFSESWSDPFVPPTILVELVGALVLAWYAVPVLLARRRG